MSVTGQNKGVPKRSRGRAGDAGEQWGGVWTTARGLHPALSLHCHLTRMWTPLSLSFLNVKRGADDDP